ncbi:uncharacterized protein J4E87_008570 [Alternaria ethzedia]|uniref:uncharacterized protein n=1 Tax=Alternaria ethzedia TaxID=181014 RepID=UPI0020C1C713|nr:uncharacterized protein J4E87_008570 [Alternaria ethzedia]KAI4617057.1 hypothetical protein J4E87_008570 [Alternaria ethzedia]
MEKRKCNNFVKPKPIRPGERPWPLLDSGHTVPMPYGEFHKETDEKVKSIRADYYILNTILIRYEGVIRKRWTKKTRTQRKAILERSWHTQMPHQHRPDLRDYYRVERREFSEASTSTIREDVYKWPYINTEDLVTPTHVLQLLNSRGRLTPSNFAETDWQSSELGRNINVIKVRPIYYDPNDEGQHKAVFEDESNGKEREGGEISRSPENEDTLREWKDKYNPSEWGYYLTMHPTDIHGYGLPVKLPVALESKRAVRRASEALIVLQIQQPLMAFLVKICLELLPDVEISLERITAFFQASANLEPLATFHKAPIQPEPPAIRTTKEDGWDSAFALAQEIPYSVPHWTDFHRIMSSIAARIHEWKDHAWAMRDDPSYFTNTFNEFCKWDAT